MAVFEGYQNFPLLTGKVKAACIGSSLMQHNTRAVSDGSYVAHWSRGWITWLNILLGQRLLFEVWNDTSDVNGRYFSGANFGVSSQNSDVVAARTYQVLRARPDICFVQIGTNNIASSTAAQIHADTLTVTEQLRNAGILTVLVNEPNRDVATWAAGSQARVQAKQLHYLRKEYADQTPGIIYVNIDKYLTNTDNADGEILTGMLDDGTHFTPKGAYYVALALYEALEPLFPPASAFITAQDDDYNATYNPYGNLLPNPFMSSNAAIGSSAGAVSNGVTGTAARNITCQRNSASGSTTAVASLEARAAGLGNYQVMTFTPGGSAVERFYVRMNGTDISHSLAENTWVQGFCDVDVSAYAGYRSLQLYMSDVHSAVLTNYAHGFEFYDTNADGLGDYPLPNAAFSGRILTPPLKLTSGSTAIRTRLEIQIDGAVAGTPIVKVGSYGIRPIKDPRPKWGF